MDSCITDDEKSKFFVGSGLTNKSSREVRGVAEGWFPVNHYHQQEKLEQLVMQQL